MVKMRENIRILIIGNDKAMVSEIKRLLFILGYDVYKIEVVLSIELSVEIAVKLKPHLVIIDIYSTKEVTEFEFMRPAIAKLNTKFLFLVEDANEQLISYIKTVKRATLITKPIDKVILDTVFKKVFRISNFKHSN